MGGIVTSVITAVTTLYFTHDFIVTAIATVSTFLFALYPDMDIHSTPRKMFLPIGLVAMLVLFALGHYHTCMALTVLLIFPLTQKHRGIVHSLLGMVLASLLWNYTVSTLSPTTWLNGYLYGVAAVVGYLTHLTLDTHFKLV